MRWLGLSLKQLAKPRETEERAASNGHGSADRTLEHLIALAQNRLTEDPPLRGAASLLDAPGSAGVESSGAEVDPPRANTFSLTATALFDCANAARRRGAWAEVLYRELQARFPESAEARLSFAIVARMQLDADDAASAIANFETYLSMADGALHEQSMAGLALAWRRLGDRERERQSWLALLGAYPRSSYAALARQRLAPDPR